MENNNAKKISLIEVVTLFLLILSAMILLYYIIRFPLNLQKHFAGFFTQFQTGEFTFPVHLFKAFLFILWFAFNSISAGYFFITTLKLESDSLSETAVISFSTGFLAIAVSVFIAGAAGILYPAVLFAMMILYSFIGLYFIIKNRKNISGAKHSLRNFPLNNISAACIAGFMILAIVFLVLFLSACSPPVQSDGIRYHLSAPQEYLKAHKLIYIPLNAFSNIPFLVEMIFVLAMGTFGDLEAQCAHLLCLIFSLFGVYAVIKRLCGNTNLAMLGVFTWGTIPSGAIISSWPFIDHGIVLFFLFHLLMLIKFFENTCNNKSAHNLPVIIFLGMSMGGLLGTKWTMVVPWLFSAGLIFIISSQLKFSLNSIRKSSNNTVIYFLVSFILFSPWIIKNLIYTGNPFYFLLSSVFPGGEWTSENARFLAAKMAEKGIGKTPLSFIRGIFDLTYYWGDYEFFNPGPIPLVIFVFMFAALRNMKNLIIFSYFTLLYILWFFSYQSGRFFMPCFAIIIILGLTGGDALIKDMKWKFASRLLNVVIFIGIIYSAGWIIRYQCAEAKPQILPAALGFQTRENFLMNSLNYYKCAEYANAIVEAPDKILLIGEHRGYYFKCGYISSDWFDTPVLLHLIRKTKSNDEIFEYLKKNNIRYIFFNYDELSKFSDRYYKPRFTTEEYKRARDFEKSAKFKTLMVDEPGKAIIKITE